MGGVLAYVLDHPHPWAFDAMIMMYGTLIVMAGAYTWPSPAMYAASSATGFFQPRTQATIDLILFVVFFISGVVRPDVCRLSTMRPSPGRSGSARTSLPKSRRSIRSRRCCPWRARSSSAQGIVEIIRCVICIKEGEWPSREEDVEEVDVDKLKEMVHVKDEDIAGLDRLVVARRTRK